MIEKKTANQGNRKLKAMFRRYPVLYIDMTSLCDGLTLVNL